MRLYWLDYFILTTYAAQIIQICFYSVPSAGSTVEMLFKVRKKPASATNHPASTAIKSTSKIIFMLAATLVVLLTSMIPLLTLLFPQIIIYLVPLIGKPSPSLSIICVLLLIFGNVLTFVAVATLRKHVRFHEFGETTHLYTSGIYRYTRNPITLGLAAIFAGFVFARPSVVMLIGFGVFLLNSNYRVKMEEVYLARTFDDKYAQYMDHVGRYFPKMNKFDNS
jgi:protein-S-isoprenylcysteine O-methyltransferase Ste14